MNRYLIEFIWFLEGDSFEESVTIPALCLGDALICVGAAWGHVEVTYHERIV